MLFYNNVMLNFKKRTMKVLSNINSIMFLLILVLGNCEIIYVLKN